MTLVNEIINEQNTESFEEFMKNFDGLEYQKSFANFETTRKPLRSNGLVSTYDTLNSLAEYGVAVEDVEEFLQEFGEMEITNDTYDNTFNYNGYLDHYVEFSMFDLENSQVLATLAIGLGLDPRGGYTDNVAFIFESKEEFFEIFGGAYSLLDFEFTAFDGKKFYASFDASCLSEFGYLSITNKETGETEYYDETILDATDKEDIRDTISEILETESVNIGKVNYFWEPCF